MKSIHPLLICVIIFFAGCEKKEPVAKTEGPSAETKPGKEIRQDTEKEAKPVDIQALPEMAKQVREKVEQREGVFYVKGTGTPYSGKWYEVEGSGKVYGIATIKDGKLEGIATWYRPNGSKAGEMKFSDGKLVKESEKWWNSKGEPVDSQKEARE